MGLEEVFMVQVHYYKRVENGIVKRIRGGFSWIIERIKDFFRAIGRLLVRDYTIVLVPHSERKVYNFHVKFITIFTGFFLVIGIAALFFLYSAAAGSARGGLTEQDTRFREAQADLERLRAEVNQLSRAARGFEAVLSGTLATMGTVPAPAVAGERASLFAPPGNGDFSREVEDLRHLAGYLSFAMEPVKEIGDRLNSQSGILSEIPSIWPIKGGIGHFTQFFGQTPDPFTGMSHLHTGIDISTYRQGDPIVATADGEVALIAYEPNGFGNYIIIRHKHGFYTRYAHMLSFRAQAGQQVKQGDVIGYIGNTGRSTGPHLHYEVHSSFEVVDPFSYLNIRPNPVR
jgi:murein DD-endopeptidase MepM/ murein hydrolase activator NlpD